MPNDSGLHQDTQKPSSLPVNKWGVLVAVSLALFLGSIDGSIVNVALPTLMREMSTDFPTIQWVVLSYLLGLTVLMVSMGRLADLVGKKRIFVTGIVLFVAGSGLCGLSPNVHWLIGFRFLQSIGASMLLALGVAIVTETWPTHERGKAIGITGGMISVGIVVGPALGGFLLEWLNWRWIFFVNLPIGAVVFVLVWIFVPSLKPGPTTETFDLIGAAVLGIGMLAFALALTVGQNIGFTAPFILLLFVTFAVTLPLFVWWERRIRYPMVDLSLFKDPKFGLNLFTGWLTFVAISGVVFLMPFYLELVMGLTMRNVGLLMSVVPIVLGIIQPFTGALSDRLGTRPVSIAGLVLIAVGYMAATSLSVDTTPAGYVLRLLPVGIGMATFQSPNNSAIMGTVPRPRLGVASGILSMTRTVGQVTGIALLGAFFNSRLQVHGGSGVELRGAAPQAIVSALNEQFWLVASLILIGLVVAIWAWHYENGQARKSPTSPQAAGN